jgi:hypothetical protein
MENNPRLKSTIIEVVDNQLDSKDPPETRQTFERLKKEGHSEIEAKELIGCVVASEIFEVLKKQEAFDLKRFIIALNNLPKIPGD